MSDKIDYSLGFENDMETPENDIDPINPFPTSEELEEINQVALDASLSPPSEEVKRTLQWASRMQSEEAKDDQIQRNAIGKELQLVRKTLGRSRKEIAAKIKITKDELFYLERGLVTNDELKNNIELWVEALNSCGADLNPQEYVDRVPIQPTEHGNDLER